MNGLNPTYYVKYLLDEFTLMQEELQNDTDFERLLPWNLKSKNSR
jgi:hypothetical protein